jgi:hypothetical protein
MVTIGRRLGERSFKERRERERLGETCRGGRLSGDRNTQKESKDRQRGYGPSKESCQSLDDGRGLITESELNASA